MSEFPIDEPAMVLERVPDYYRIGCEVEHNPPPWANPRSRVRCRMSQNKHHCVSAKAKARKKRR